MASSLQEKKSLHGNAELRSLSKAANPEGALDLVRRQRFAACLVAEERQRVNPPRKLLLHLVPISLPLLRGAKHVAA